ncbi:MAG: glycosyltransferase [Solirubrobacteraceae bacterium]
MRPTVDVVVPFVGPDAELTELCQHIGALDLREGDSAVVVDNRPAAGSEDRVINGVRVIGAPELQTSYHARNRGAQAGHAAWLVFVDADVRVPADLIESYFEPEPGDQTGVLAGEIGNETVTGGERRALAVRYAHLAELFAQRKTLETGEFAYAMTANCAIRRTAFAAVTGFVDNVRSGGDADICFRIVRAGWEIESRSHAAVTHVNRPTVRKLVRQSARHGSGAAWLNRVYPGFSRPSRLSGLLYRSTRALLAAVISVVQGNRDQALVTSIDAVRSVAFEAGRRASNEVSPPSG